MNIATVSDDQIVLQPSGAVYGAYSMFGGSANTFHQSTITFEGG